MEKGCVGVEAGNWGPEAGLDSRTTERWPGKRGLAGELRGDRDGACPVHLRPVWPVLRDDVCDEMNAYLIKAYLKGRGGD